MQGAKGGERRFVSIGECMVELSQAGPDTFRRGFAGDTFNTAWYARHLLPESWTVDYASCIGTDAISDEMAAFMEASGIGTAHLRRVGGRSVGLYMISTDKGERSFSYWRSHSAARTMIEDRGWLDRTLAGATLVHLSGITLAILPPEHRRILCNVLGKARAAGTLVSFDTNLRPRLWESMQAMREGLTMGAAVADVVLPSFDEEESLFGDEAPADTAVRYRDGGSGTVVVKNGKEDVTLWSSETGLITRRPAPVDHVVDTTAAGDSFAAGLLAGLVTGQGVIASVDAAMALSGRVIQAPGALVRNALDPKTAAG